MAKLSWTVLLDVHCSDIAVQLVHRHKEVIGEIHAFVFNERLQVQEHLKCKLFHLAFCLSSKMLSVALVLWLQTIQDGNVSFGKSDAEFLKELAFILIGANVEA